MRMKQSPIENERKDREDSRVKLQTKQFIERTIEKQHMERRSGDAFFSLFRQTKTRKCLFVPGKKAFQNFVGTGKLVRGCFFFVCLDFSSFLDSSARVCRGVIHCALFE